MTDKTSRPDISLFIRHATTLALMARGFVSYQLIKDIVNSAPASEAQRDSQDWRENSLCWRLLLEVHELRKLYPWAEKEFDDAAAFWLEEYPVLPLAERLGRVYFINHNTDYFAAGKNTVTDSYLEKYFGSSIPDECKVLDFPTRHA